MEETIPDGTKFTPGKYFTKIWVIRNTGVCAWNEDFLWVLAEGGNATDAAVATALALSITEPWMSGLGGCGYLVTYQAERGAVAARAAKSDFTRDFLQYRRY